MEIGGVNKTSVGAATQVAPRQDVNATAGTAAVDLKPEQTVQATPAGDAVQVTLSNDADAAAKRMAALRDVIDRRVETDPRTREVVYKFVREGSGQVLLQRPDEQVLRLREYLAQANEQRKHADGQAPQA
ncbi:MAG: hypothetical protein ACRC56_13615, partial [Bosea sp. (in: a-proteobacteria)]